MLKLTVPLVLISISACHSQSDTNALPETITPKLAAATGCEYEATGTSLPPSSGNPTVIDDVTGTVISANFFNSGAINPPHFDGQEFVSVCVSPVDGDGNRTATITSDVGLDNNFQIKAYPEFVVGTKFGNQFETSFRYYNMAGLPPEDKWPVIASGTDDAGNPFEFANLEYVSVKKDVGLPAFTSTLPEIFVTLDIDENNVVGSERDIMLESWFHDTSKNAVLIGNNSATNQPIANSLNNIVGIGHKHYPQLDNTLLEMMVHIAPLSPHDISQAQNNPGQNQLTEIYSGKDYDGDGIDDHFDVDSHASLNSNNPNLPSPGIYSSGIDNNSDGIDDADLLPVVIGDFAYSIWYGESVLAPIVIFSRETNSSLTNDFDPNTPDMDVSTEGEIILPWHSFVDFTLYDVESSLQALSVNWATGTNNPFPKMRSLSGAISGVEFGVEPQTNTPADQPYELFVKRYIVEVGSSISGLLTNIDGLSDNETPTTGISLPSSPGSVMAPGTALSGTASDVGGSGFDEIRISIRDRSQGQWVSFNGSQGTTASLSATTANSTNWQLTNNLAVGDYTLYVRALDNAGNLSPWQTRLFSVGVADNQAPTTSFSTPASQNAVIAPGTALSGTASDVGGSGFDEIRISIRNRSQGQWVSFNGSQGTTASLSATTANSTNWQLTNNLAVGDYTLYVRALDNAGNLSPWQTRLFSVGVADNQAPTTSFSTPASQNAVIAPGTALSGTASDVGGSGFDEVRISIRNRTLGQWVTFNGSQGTTASLSATTANSTNWQLTNNLAVGDYTLYVRALDNAGNLSPWQTRLFSVGVADNQAPTTSFSTPASQNAVIAPGTALSGTASDVGGSGFAEVRISIRNRTLGQWITFNGSQGTTASLSATTANSTNWQLTNNLAVGDYTLYVRALDNAGNLSPWQTRLFSVGVADNQAPTTSFSTPASQNAVIAPGTALSGTASDVGGSGFDEVRISIRNRTLGQWVTFNGSQGTTASLSATTTNGTNWQLTNNLAAGDYTLYVRALDNAGNLSPWQTRLFSVQ